LANAPEVGGKASWVIYSKTSELLGIPSSAGYTGFKECVKWIDLSKGM
jgi:hypothetical protein